MPDLKVPFALVDGQLVSPQPGLRGICPASDCSAAVVARCGPQRAWHFAHIGQCLGGSTSGPETGWHLGWKCEFPVEWQEVVHHDQHGEKHIADVKTPDGWAIEIQHSPITLEERRSREAVYGPRLVWIVDALTRNGEREQFEKLWEDGAPVGRGSPIRRVSTKHCVRLQGWAGSRSQVIFDLGDDRELLWLFHLQRPDGLVYIANHLKRADLVELHRRVNTPKEQAFEAGLSHIINFIAHFGDRERFDRPS